MHVARRLLADGREVLGLDDLNAYYDPRLKERRVRQLESFANFQFEKLDVADRKGMTDLFAGHRFSEVVHLAAQAGVRYSLSIHMPMPIPISSASSTSSKAAD